MGTRLIGPVFGLALACASAGLGQGRGEMIEGTVHAVPGKTLANAVVVVCPVENGACDEARSRAVPVQGGGPSASFQVAGLEAVPHVVLAWRDVNANGQIEAGDELALHARNGQAWLVTPPASRLELRLQGFTGDAALLFGPAQPASVAPPGPSSPAAGDARALVGLWSTTGATPLELANAPGIVDTSAGSYRFEANGRYTSARMLESDGPVWYMRVVVYDEGTYTVRGEALTLQYRRRTRSWNSSGLQGDKASQGAQTYRWRTGPASSGGALSLYLTDEEGTRLEYPRR